MGRRTKAEIIKEKLPILINDIIQYITKNGKVVTKNFIYWNTYPVCVKDVCVTTVAVVDGRIIFGDYDEKKTEFPKIYHTTNDVEYEFILEAFNEIKEADEKANKKKLKN